MTRFVGRGTRSNFPNRRDRSVDWRRQIEIRGKEREKRVRKKERIVGKKESYIERVKIQDIKSKLWYTEGVVMGVRTADDGIIVSYDMNAEGWVTTRHRK